MEDKDKGVRPPMAEIAALMPGMSGVDLRNSIVELYDFSVRQIGEVGVLELDDGSIGVDELFEIRHFITAVEDLYQREDLEQALLEAGLDVLGNMGEVTIDQYVKNRYREFVPYYVILCHILGVKRYQRPMFHDPEVNRAPVSRSSNEVSVSTYIFSPRECGDHESLGATLCIATKGSRTIISDSVMPF